MHHISHATCPTAHDCRACSRQSRGQAMSSEVNVDVKVSQTLLVTQGGQLIRRLCLTFGVS
jgi:hypothetical protein